MRLFPSLWILLALTFCASAADLDPTAIRKAAEYSANYRGGSFLVIQNGKTLLEEYPGRASADTPQRIYSGTKAFWNLAALAWFIWAAIVAVDALQAENWPKAQAYTLLLAVAVLIKIDDRRR